MRDPASARREEARIKALDRAGKLALIAEASLRSEPDPALT